MKSRELILAAADLIEQPGCWTQEVLARDKKGDPINPTSPQAVRWCAIGAIRKIGGDDELAIALAISRLRDIATWNDQPERSAAQVAARLRSIARAKGPQRRTSSV